MREMPLLRNVAHAAFMKTQSERRSTMIANSSFTEPASTWGLVPTWHSNPERLQSLSKTLNHTRIQSSRRPAILKRIGPCTIPSRRVRTPRARDAWWRILFFCSVCSILLIVSAPKVAAQPGQNIAGNYRGLMTSCLSLVRSADCRQGFTELVRLADEVDARRVEWERVTAAGGVSAPRMQENYAQALEQLNRAVADFNRNMSAPPAGGK